MAWPGGEFNATDVGSGPSRRLYFIAKTDKHWIVSYEHGGWGYHAHCFFITIDDGNNLLIQNSNIKLESLEFLKAFITKEKILLEPWNGYEY